MPNIVQNSETSHNQSLCNEISAILGGGDMMHYRPPIRHFFLWGGRVPVSRGIYATASDIGSLQRISTYGTNRFACMCVLLLFMIIRKSFACSVNRLKISSSENRPSGTNRIQ